jgi:hypothetical protein
MERIWRVLPGVAVFVTALAACSTHPLVVPSHSDAPSSISAADAPRDEAPELPPPYLQPDADTRSPPGDDAADGPSDAVDGRGDRFPPDLDAVEAPGDRPPSGSDATDGPSDRPDLGSDATDARSDRPDLGSDATDGRSDRPDLGSDAADGRSDRPDLGSDRPDDRPAERSDAGSDGAADLGGDGLTLVAWVQSVGGTPIRLLKRERYVFLGDWEDKASYAAGGSGEAGSVQTYDVADPQLPVLRSTLFTPYDQVQDLAMNGPWLFVANDAQGLRLVDSAQPEALRSVANRANNGRYATAVAVAARATDAGQQLYALAGYLYGGGLDIHAVPAGGPIPDPVQHYASTALSGRCDVHQIQVRDERAYILASDGENQGCFEILDLSRLPAAPTMLGRMCMPFSSLGGIGDIRVSGDHLYFSASYNKGPGGLRVINVQNAAQPALVASLDLANVGSIPWKGTGLAVAGNEVFFVTAAGVQVIDVSTPTEPALRGFAPFPAAFGICEGGTAVVEADLLYVGAYCGSPSGRGGLAIYRRFVR